MSNNPTELSVDTLRYRAKQPRRPVRFWWQALLLQLFIVLLWWQLPLPPPLSETTCSLPLPTPRAAYTVLSTAEGAAALAKMRASWASGVSVGTISIDLDLSMFAAEDATPPPTLLEQGAIYPGTWQPTIPAPLPLLKPQISHEIALSPPFTIQDAALKPNSGIVWRVSHNLAAAHFNFTPPDTKLPERSGECSFWVECRADGTVEHLLLLTPPGTTTPLFEHAVARGHATRTATGTVAIAWRQALTEPENKETP